MISSGKSRHFRALICLPLMKVVGLKKMYSSNTRLRNISKSKFKLSLESKTSQKYNKFFLGSLSTFSEICIDDFWSSLLKDK